MPETQDGDKEQGHSLIGLMVVARSMNGNIGTLRQLDNSRRSGAGESEAAAAIEARESLIQVRDILAYDQRPETAELRADVTRTINDTLAGYEYRKQHNLPGLRTQFLEARRQLVTGEGYSALDELSRQPDGVGLVEQLRTEYETFEQVLDEGGALDIDQLEKKIYEINHGLDFVGMDMAIGRWRSLQDMKAKLAGSLSLAKAQGRERLIEQLELTAKKFASDIAIQAADNLNMVIARLSIERKLNTDEEYEFHGAIPNLKHQNRGAEVIQMSLARADRLTGVSDTEPRKPISLEDISKGLEDSDKKIAAISSSLSKARDRVRKYGRLPFLGVNAREEVSRVEDRMRAAEQERRQLRARAEMATQYNKLLEFGQMIAESSDVPQNEAK